MEMYAPCPQSKCCRRESLEVEPPRLGDVFCGLLSVEEVDNDLEVLWQHRESLC
jgi:hypothetical protein